MKCFGAGLIYLPVSGSSACLTLPFLELEKTPTAVAMHRGDP